MCSKASGVVTWRCIDASLQVSSHSSRAPEPVVSYVGCSKACGVVTWRCIDACLQVSAALTDEIRRLAALVDEFERPFHPDPLVLNTYKKVCFIASRILLVV